MSISILRGAKYSIGKRNLALCCLVQLAVLQECLPVCLNRNTKSHQAALVAEKINNDISDMGFYFMMLRSYIEESNC